MMVTLGEPAAALTAGPELPEVALSAQPEIASTATAATAVPANRRGTGMVVSSDWVAISAVGRRSGPGASDRTAGTIAGTDGAGRQAQTALRSALCCGGRQRSIRRSNMVIRVSATSAINATRTIPASTPLMSVLFCEFLISRPNPL